jgi:hypothetical protein
VTLWIPAHDAAAQEGQAEASLDYGTNVRITILVGKVLDNGTVQERAFRLVGREGGPRSEMLLGWRTPIPASQAGADDDGKTSYVYQNVGVSANLEFRAAGAGRFSVYGVLEVSGVIEPEVEGTDETRPPTIGTFQQQLSVVLDEGKELRVADMPHPEGGKLFIDLKAETLP